uniref:Putative threonine/serine-rich mucin n=1 Tax=Toxorhynchites amboinensis TaxID=46208 RepID=A0FIV0_TOXAM|nr:putative threonine/serine-rich mucin [Toxorhynchites amboinensis]
MVMPVNNGSTIFLVSLFGMPTYTSGTSSTSSTSSSTARSPVNATISLGNRENTSAVEDLGTNIDGLTISRSKRFVPLLIPNVTGFSFFQNLPGIFTRQKRAAESIPPLSNESVIRVGNQIIKLPPRGISNLTIHIIDGGSYSEKFTPFQTPANGTWAPFVDQIKNFFDGLFV